jgi:CRISPR-associated protein Cmr3
MNKPFDYNYRITFRPLDFFFFGGENTFGNGEGQNYYAKTRPYPQQTTVLGVLRYLGLKEAKSALPIGESFVAKPQYYEPDENGRVGEVNFGFIRQVSPLFMRKESGSDSGNYAFGPSFLPVVGAGPPQSPAGTVKQYRNGEWKNTWELPALDPKKWLDPILLGDNATILDRSKVITTSARIGITKNKDGEERKDGFYKQEVGRLAYDWVFAVHAKLDKDLAPKIASPVVVPFGAEKALFAVTLTALDDKETSQALFAPENFAAIRSSHLRAAALISDAYVDKEAFEALPYAVAGTVDFRNIRTPTKITNFGRFRRNSRTMAVDRMTQSGKYTLLSRGSILYAETEEKLTALLHDKCHAHWRTIGYNHFISL